MERKDALGMEIPIPVTYKEKSYFIIGEMSECTVMIADDLSKLDPSVIGGEGVLGVSWDTIELNKEKPTDEAK